MVSSCSRFTFSNSDTARIMETLPFPVLCVSKDLCILGYNEALTAFLGVESSTDKALDILDIMPSSQANGLCTKTSLQNALEHAYAQGTFQSAWTIHTAQDKNILTKITVVPVSLDNDNSFFLYIHHEKPCTNCENATRRSQAFLSSILDSLPIAMTMWSKDHQLIDCSAYVQNMYNVESKDVYKQDFMKFSPEYQVDGRSEELVSEYLDKAFTDGIYKFQWLSQDSTGRIFPTEETLCCVDFHGDPVVFGFTQDNSIVTESLKNIIHMEERTRAILDATPMAVLLWDKNFTLKDSNLKSLNIYNFEDKQELFNCFDEVIPLHQPDGALSSEIIQETLNIAFETGYHHIPKFYCQTREGIALPVEVTTIRVVIRDEVMVITYLRDLREILQVLDAMKAHEERIQNILDSTPMAIHLWNTKHEVIDTNLESLYLFGCNDKNEFIECLPRLAPKHQPDGAQTENVMRIAIDTAFEKGQYHIPQLYCQTKTGASLPVEVTLIRMTVRDEEIVIGYMRDLREVLRALEQMKENEERVQSILDAAPMAIKIWDGKLQVRDVNQEYLRLYGYQDKSELDGIQALSLPEKQPDGTPSVEFVTEKILRAFSQGMLRFEMVVRHLDGSPIPIEVTMVRMVLHNEPMVVGYVRDLREITEFIRKIQESEIRTQSILDLSPLGINVWDKDLNLVDCNKAIVRLYGFKNQKEYLANRYSVLPEKQPNGAESIPLAIEKIQEAFSLGHSCIEAMTNDLQGNIIPVDIMLKRSNLGGEDVVIGYVRDLREFKSMLAEIHAVEQDLRSARDVAVQSARAKSEFLANMSHEIRTPLNGVLGLLHLLSNTTLEDMQKDYVTKTIFSAENLLRIINDILDFSKIDAGKLEIESIPFALEDIASELKILFEPQANNKNLAMTFKYDTCIKQVLLGDPLRIKQIFFNLIGNSIKFTDTGGITISMTGEEKEPGKLHCLFCVKDSGIGMNDEQRSRLFSAFMQADTSVTRKYGGTGLGLVIARRIANLMGGDLWVESEEGQGSTFSFTAIFEHASQDAQLLPTYDIHVHAESNASHTEENNCAQAEAAKPSQEEASAKPAETLTEAKDKQNCFHILLVEDNEINQLIAEELLKNAGHSVDIANNGQEALDLLEKNTYNIILMDIQMPIMDGLTTVSKIRNDVRLVHMPVIAMSAHAMKGDREISLHHGMNEHITKPISPEILYATVNEWALPNK